MIRLGLLRGARSFVVVVRDDDDDEISHRKSEKLRRILASAHASTGKRDGMTSKRHCGNTTAPAPVPFPSPFSSAALQTQLDATGFRPEIFKCLGHPWGARRAMYFLAHNELLVCAATCLILKEWSAHYVWAWTHDRGRAEMPTLADNSFDVSTMMVRIAPRFTNLRTVCLNKAGWDGRFDIDDAGVVTLAKNCAALTDVAVNSCRKLTDASIMALAIGCVNVRRLDLFYCPKITDASMTYLVSQCSELTDLNVCHCYKLTVANLTAISSNCPGLLRLRYGYPGCDSVTDESVSALFAGSPKLTSIQLRGCRSLTKVVLPDSITEIGNEAFAGCSSLASITVPGSVTSIGDSAFSFCSSLASISIPDSVTSIGYRAFACCSSLASITIPDSTIAIKFLLNTHSRFDGNTTRL